MQLCLWQNCLYALLTNTSLFYSMFEINDVWWTICHKGVTSSQNLDIITTLQLFKSCEKGGTEIVQVCNSCDFVLALFLLWEWNYLITWYMRTRNLQKPEWGGAKRGIHCLNCQLLFRLPFGCIRLSFFFLWLLLQNNLWYHIYAGYILELYCIQLSNAALFCENYV